MPIEGALDWAIKVIWAMENDSWRETCLQDSDRTEHNGWECSEGNIFKNSARKQLGPGHVHNCIEEMATTISTCDMGSSNLFLKSYESFEILSLLKKQIGGLFWSSDLPSRRVHLFPPRLLSKNEAAICGPCVRWAEVSMTCTVVRPTAGEF